jgi:hypothetical protein
MILGILASGGAGAAAGDFQSIATANGTGASGTITFSSIPSTYTHLQLRMLTRDSFVTTGVDYVKLRFNSDTGTNYARHVLSGDGATATATGGITLDNILLYGHPLGSNAANIMGSYIVDVTDYANTSKNKTVRSFSGCDLNGSGNVYLTSGLWLNTNAISTITIDAGGIFFTTSSTFALYGIKAAA